jgi:glycosyltransferase involved in cell wall biosynthesis
MTSPVVSIVTPSYNQADFLEETIRSVLEQDYEPLEYILIDDGSTDDSPAIAERYSDRLSLIRRENAGQPAALNRGFERATGELLGFVNSDDTLLPGAVTAMVDELIGDPELLLVYGDAVYTDEQSRQAGYLRAREFDLVEMVRRCDNHVVQPSTLWRREAWERFGPLNEEGYYFFDFEFFLRFPPERVKRLAKPLSTYRVHPTAKSAGAAGARLARDHERLAETFFTSDRLPEPARAVADEGRSLAHLLGAEFAYEALELGLARRYVLEGLRLHVRHALSPRWLSLLAKTLLPRRMVARLRSARRQW